MLKVSIIAAILAASVGIWCWIFLRRQAGLPLIPLARRRPVPWLGRDVLFIFLIAVILPGLAIRVVTAIGGTDAAQQSAATITPEAQKAKEKLETEHPTVDLLGSGDWRMIAVAIFLAVILAPILEEFLFRVVLQGWLEGVWSRRRRTRRELRCAPFSWIPLLLPAILFALVHFRVGHEVPTPESLNTLLLGHAVRIVADLATLAVAIIVLRFGVGATAADLGWQPKQLPLDGKLAIVALGAVMPPLLLLQGALNAAVSKADIAIAPDPIPLFFLALAFGLLYRRTHRLAPSLILHMAFNATSVVMYFLSEHP
jgi:membrane protease YdiL (CAAX protease family)